MEFELELSNYSTEELEELKSFLLEEEAKVLTYEEKKNLPDSSFAVVITVKDKRTGKPRKIRKYPLIDETRVRAALRYLGMPRNQKALKKLGVSVESVRKKILKRAKQLNMTTLLERYKSNIDGGKDMEERIKELEQEVATLKEELKKKDEEIAKKTEEAEKSSKVVEELKKESDEAKKKIEEVEEAKTKEIEKAREDATTIAERRAELGETELKDEDLLNDDKYEKAKLEKELKEKDKEIAELKEGEKPDLDKGSKKKTTDEDEYAESRKKIKKLAFGTEEE